MTFEAVLNPSVEKEDEKRLLKHLYSLWNLFWSRLEIGIVVVSTIDLMDCGKAQYGARLYELRRIMIPGGYCIDKVKRGKGGVNYYAIVPNERSTFYAKLKREGRL
jgi:hypothetical protein